MKQLLVTVGSTQFPKLIATTVSNSFQKELVRNKFTHLVIQHGTTLINYDQYSPELKITTFEYQQSLQTWFESSDLIISHGGAGTILEVLRLGKPLVVVTNDDLADSHQSELSSELNKRGFLILSTCE